MDPMDSRNSAEIVKKIAPIPLGPKINLKEETEIYIEPDLEKTNTKDKEANIKDKEAKTGNESFFGILIKLWTTNVKSIPNYVMRNVFWLAPLCLIWLVVWPLKLYTFPAPIEGIFMFIVFLTATYNNFVAKAIMIGFIGGTLIPTIKEIKATGSSNVINKYKKAIDVIVSSFKRMKSMAIPVFLIGCGIALFVSNFLTRNNKVDKYLVCLATGIILIQALTRGTQSAQVRLIKAFLNDVMRFFKPGTMFDNNFIFVLFAGLATGFVGAIVSFLLYGILGDYAGYILGIIVAAVGVGLTFLKGKPIHSEGK